MITIERNSHSGLGFRSNGMPQCRHRMRLRMSPLSPASKSNQRPRFGPDTQRRKEPFLPHLHSARALRRRLRGLRRYPAISPALACRAGFSWARTNPIDVARLPTIPVYHPRSLARGVIRRLQLSEADLDHGLGPHAMWAGRDAYVQIAIARFPSRHPLALSGTRSEAQSGKRRHAPAGVSRRLCAAD